MIGNSVTKGMTGVVFSGTNSEEKLGDAVSSSSKVVVSVIFGLARKVISKN